MPHAALQPRNKRIALHSPPPIYHRKLLSLSIPYVPEKFKTLPHCAWEICNYSALRLHSYTAVLSALLMYTFCTKSVQNCTVKLIFLTKSMSKILAFYGRLNCYPFFNFTQGKLVNRWRLCYTRCYYFTLKVKPSI